MTPFELTFGAVLGAGLAFSIILFLAKLIEAVFFWIGFNIGKKNKQDTIIESIVNENKQLREELAKSTSAGAN